MVRSGTDYVRATDGKGTIAMLDDFADLTPAEREAFALSQAAIMLDQAKMKRDDQGALVGALNNNLELWVAIKTLVTSADSPLPQAVRDNILRLARFVADTTFRHGTAISDATLDTLANINFQLAEGLLEGERNRTAAKAA